MIEESLPPALAQWRSEGRTFNYRGHEIFYRQHGAPANAPVLVCLHGFPTASWDWHLLWPALCERFGCVIAADMIGFGFSAKPARYRYSINDQADLHDALLAALGVRRAHLLAHDYGDTVAQELIARQLECRLRGARPYALESVCLLNGGLFPETHRARLVQKLLASKLGAAVARLLNERAFRRGFAAVFGARTQPDDEALRAFWTLVRHGNGQRLAHKLIAYMRERRAQRPRWVGALMQSSVPIRLIDGIVDPVSGAHMAARYRELIPNPDVVELRGIGHYPQIEAPAATLRAFFEFHDRLGRR